MTETICKILLSIMIGILSTGLLTLGVGLAVCCVDELTNYIQGCIAEFRYTKPINWCQMCFDIITVINLLGTTALISAYVYFQS